MYCMQCNVAVLLLRRDLVLSMCFGFGALDESRPSPLKKYPEPPSAEGTFLRTPNLEFCGVAYC